jgi:hypothetical protein
MVFRQLAFPVKSLETICGVLVFYKCSLEYWFLFAARLDSVLHLRLSASSAHSKYLNGIPFHSTQKLGIATSRGEHVANCPIQEM